MTTHIISVDARRPESSFALRITGYSSARVEISVRDGASLPSDSLGNVVLWYGPEATNNDPQTGHAVAASSVDNGCATIDLTLQDTSFEGKLIAQIVANTPTGSYVLAVGTIWMLRNPARDTAPMAFDTPPWATPADVLASIRATFADFEDLPANASASQANTLLRRMLAAFKGVVPLFLMACAVQAEPVRHGDILEDSMVETNGVPASVVAQMIAEGGSEADTIALEALTNHVENVSNPHGVTAAQVGALPGIWNSEFSRFEAGNTSAVRFKSISPSLYFEIYGGSIWLTFGSKTVKIAHDGGSTTGGTGRWLWPDTASSSPLVKRDELDNKLSAKASAADLTNTVNALLPSAEWVVRTGLSGTVAFTAVGARPQAWSGSGALVVSSFASLPTPTPIYWTLQGFDSVTLPAGIYAVGGGTWQTNAVNHFVVWQIGSKQFINFVTASEIE